MPARIAMITAMAEQMTAAAAAGDPEAARVAHEAIGRLLAGVVQIARVIDITSAGPLL